jgi:geranylgeranyl pyrophosphate synthase
MADLRNFFKECSRLVDAELERLIPTAPERLYDAVRWSVFAGGKRFRPALVIAVGRAFGASDEQLIKTAAAIEMIHTYSLIHDDLPAMDDDDLRRGRATCHVKFGEATAILAGDVLQSLAFGAIANDPTISDAARVRLIAELSDAASKMVDGQQLDLEYEGRPITIEELERIHRSKTGAVIHASAVAGAIIAGADEDEIGAIGSYASKLGLLFQITDDILDVTQTTEILGKTAGKDVASEKATYPLLLGQEKSFQLARSVHASAIAAISEIDRDLAVIVHLADFILNRKS